jgi:hypothetical protein
MCSVAKLAAILSALFAIAYAAVRPAPSRGKMPADVRGLAARVAAHPADWMAASALAERALDAPVPDRIALWRASSALAISMAPYRPEPRTAFARSAFFHWGELSDADRKAVLDAYAPVLLDDSRTFMTMSQTLYALTGDLGYLRRAQPPRADTARRVAWIAGTYGRFDDYRAIRAEIERQYGESTARPEGNPADSRTVEAAHGLDVTVATVMTDEVPPYVEIYVDDARRAEGVVAGQQTFAVPIGGAGEHRLEVRLANPITRNGTPRRVRVVSVQAL